MNKIKPVSIAGIGAITNLGNDVNEIWSNLMSKDDAITMESKIPFDSGLSSSQKKKANRYSEMGIYVSKKALEDYKKHLDFENADKTRIGTIFTTGYGPIVSTMQFSKSIAEEDYEFCSPALFANTVHNACVGHICMILGLKGVSSVLMGSNNLEYTTMLLNAEKADYILTGSIEEHCEDLNSAFKNHTISKNILIKEAAVAFLTSDENRSDTAYCTIADTVEFNLGCFPLTEVTDKTKTYEKIQKAIQELFKKYEIDAFFSSSNETYFDDIEISAAKDAMGNDVVFVNDIKKLFGETLGSAFNVNAMIAALCIKNGKLPLKLNLEQKNIRNALVSGYDILGNYFLTVLTK